MDRLRKKNRITHRERSSGKQTSSDPPRQRYRRSSGPPKEPDLGPLFVSSSSIQSHSTLLLPQFSAGSSPSQAPHHRHARKIKTLNLACQGPVDPSRRTLQAFPCSAQGTWSDGDQRQHTNAAQCNALSTPSIKGRNSGSATRVLCLSLHRAIMSPSIQNAEYHRWIRVAPRPLSRLKWEVQAVRPGVGTQGSSGQGCEALASQPLPTATPPKRRLAMASTLGLSKPGSGSLQLLFCDDPGIARFPLDFLVPGPTFWETLDVAWG